MKLKQTIIAAAIVVSLCNFMTSSKRVGCGSSYTPR